MAALIAAAAEPMPDVAFVPLESDGVTLIYGKDEQAIEAAKLLIDHLDVTVLIKAANKMTPPRVTDFPVVKGTIRQAKGTLGTFELTIDDYAAPAPSSRGALEFSAPRNGAMSRCDILIDLSGGTPLFPAADLREGYLRADPGDPAAVLRAVLKARDLTGSFDKPRYVTFTADLCAHSRSKIVGCRRCLDLCPTGAITPDGDHVAIDAGICAGCGQCAAACPTGAAAYALPPSDALLRKLRTLLTAYREAGGKNPVLLFHDGEHGIELIDALARHGDGLPANVLPVQVNEITQVGLEAVAAAFAYGASALRFLLRAKPRHDVAGLAKTIALAEPILSGLGFAGARVATIETDDPDALGEALYSRDRADDAAAKPASFSAVGGKRDVVRLALRELHGARRRRSISWRCRKARRSAPSSSMSKAARCACPASPPARPARSATIRSGQCCALPRMPACNAGCARRPARRKSSASSRSSISAPRWRRPASSSRKSRRCASVAASRSASRARSIASPPSSRPATGCIRTPRNVSTSSRCAPTAARSSWPRRISIRSARRSGRRSAPPTIICANASGRASD